MRIYTYKVGIRCAFNHPVKVALHLKACFGFLARVDGPFRLKVDAVICSVA